MNLYLLTQKIEQGYDTFDSAVVVAECDLAARNTHPYPQFYCYIDGEEHHSYKDKPFAISGAWAQYSKDVKVELIGTTDKEPGVILASFNAG